MTQVEKGPVAWAHYSTFDNLDALAKSRFTATLSKKETDACCVPLYVTQLQRPWVGLTDEEIEQLHTTWVLGGGFRQLCNAIQAKLKEKNT